MPSFFNNQLHAEEESPLDETETLSEVEIRLHKANYYRAVLDQQLFGEDESEAAVEVSGEFREFALKRLRVLMGIQAEESQQSKPDIFTEEQLEALRVWADRLINKPALMEARLPPQVPTIAPVSTTPQPPKVQTVQVAAPSKTKKTSKPSKSLKKNEKTAKEDPKGVKTDPDTGEKYFEVKQETVDEKGRPTVRAVRMSLNNTQAPINDPNYKPMPPKDQMIVVDHQKAMQAQQGQMTNPLLAGLLNKLVKSGVEDT